jgi:iron complex outermembrane recepter protein
MRAVAFHFPLLFALAGPVHAQVAASQLADLSLEQLRDVRVVTVSRLEEGLDRVAASAYVITGEEIRRSGATSIAQALRLAPTLDVARADANQYAISARGFNNVLANKMLVLIDGRAVYTPLFSGVFWEAQDVVLGDVERIEVITGPSTALWGSNAVNGLIHVITKPASATAGAALSAELGSRQRHGDLRYGARLGEGSMRLYAKAYEREDTQRADGSSVQDAAHGQQAGFRADWSDADERVTLQGDVYDGSVGQGGSARTFSGGNLLARWERTDASGAGWTLQAYLDHTQRRIPQLFRESLDTVDLVAQYGFAWGARHRALIGAGLRHARDDVDNSAALAFQPGSRSLQWSRLFAQDRFEVRDGLDATLAASLEHNPYTGLEVLPSARLAWRIDATRLAWAAMSRAVRAPSRIDREFFQPGVAPYVLAGGPDFLAEVSNTLELGYRAQRGSGISYALTLFRHEHDRLRSLAPTPQGLQFRNDIDGSTQGLEAWSRWRVNPRWRLHAGFVVQRQRLAVRSGAVDAGGLAALGNDPRYWASLHSMLDLSPRVAWDLRLRRVGSRPLPEVPAYTALDSRLAYQTDHGVELALLVKNAFDRDHPEWGPATNRVELEREVSLQLSWQY